LPKGRYGFTLSVGELGTQPSNCEADTLPLSYLHPNAMFVANAWVSGDITIGGGTGGGSMGLGATTFISGGGRPPTFKCRILPKYV